MIRSIRLVNWRSHSDTRLEFRKGTNLIVGIMGAGKSSVLEAISFALYGTLPALERRKIKLENVIRNSEEKASVELEFTWDGEDYRVEREIERTKRGTSSKAELFRAGALIESGSVAVTGHVASLMGADYDLFTRAIYSEQNNIDHFLNLDPRRRKEEIDSLLGLDRFELARVNAVAVANRVKSKRQVLEGKRSQERLSELEKREKELSLQEKGLSARAASLAAQEKEAESRLALGRGEFAKMKEAKERADGMEKEAIRLRALRESLSKDLPRIEPEEIAAAEKSLKESSERKASLSESLRSIEKQSTAISKEMGSADALRRRAADAAESRERMGKELESMLRGASLPALEEARKDAEKEFLSLKSESHSLGRELAELEELVPRLKPGLSRCPLCSSALSAEGISHVKAEKEALAEAKRMRIAEAGSLLPRAEKMVEGYSARIRAASSLAEKMEAAAKEADALPRLKAALEALSQKAAALEKERETLRKSIDEASASESRAKSRLEGAAEARRRAERLKEAEKALAELEPRIATLGFDPAVYEKAREFAEKAAVARERASAEAKAASTQHGMVGESLAALRGEIALLRAIENDIKEISVLEEQLSIYKGALLETQASLRLELGEAINSAMNEIWSIFYPYRNYHGLRLLASERDYVFEVSDGSSWKQLDTVASGGERACAALALRMSLAMVLTPKLSWLILDEPTHNLDSASVEMLSHALQFRVPEVVKQTFVVTHDEAFMGSDFASSFRLERDKNSGGETRAESA